MGRILILVGLVLQVVGLLIVLWQIHGAENALKREHWWREVGRWIAGWIRLVLIRLHLKKGRHILAVGAAEAATAATAARLRVRPGLIEDAPPEEQLAAHTKYLQAIDAELDEIYRLIDERHTDAGRLVAELRAQRQDQERELRTQVEELGIGARGWQIAGVVLGSLGVIAATVGGLLLSPSV